MRVWWLAETDRAAPLTVHAAGEGRHSGCRDCGHLLDPAGSPAVLRLRLRCLCGAERGVC